MDPEVTSSLRLMGLNGPHCGPYCMVDHPLVRSTSIPRHGRFAVRFEIEFGIVQSRCSPGHERMRSTSRCSPGGVVQELPPGPYRDRFHTCQKRQRVNRCEDAHTTTESGV